jgi:hypothetical protein
MGSWGTHGGRRGKLRGKEKVKMGRRLKWCKVDEVMK